MKQTEVKARRFYAALIAAALAAALGACGEGWGNQETPPPPQASETGAPEIAYNTGDLVKVRVKVPQQSQSGARSITTDAAQWFADTYEVIFRKIVQAGSPEKDVYYRGAGANMQGYISVDVPVGTGYEVLLIAGIGQTLVGAGYRGANNDPADAVEIKAGIVNEIPIEVTALTPQWNTSADNAIKDSPVNDFAFFATLTNFDPDLAIMKRGVHLAPSLWEAGEGEGINADKTKTTDDIDDASDTFGVAFDISDYLPLALADIRTKIDHSNADNSSYTLTLPEDPKVKLWPQYPNDTFVPVTFALDTGASGVLEKSSISSPTNDTGYVGYATSDKKTFPDTARLAFKTSTPLPNKDTNALLQFDVKYRAFGTSYSGGTTWTIRNGLYNSPDDNTGEDGESDTGSEGAGSYIPVVIGKGTPLALIGMDTKVYPDN